MAQTERLDFAQPDNELSKIAEQQRARLFPKNDYKSTNQYSSTNPDALADGDEYGKGYRDIEPVCVGYSKKGELVLRAWERQGVSHSKVTKNNPIPGWRFFKLVKILTYQPQGDNFYEMRPDYNPDGDKLMSSVILNAKFDNTENLT
jgi:hypothetical protein